MKLTKENFDKRKNLSYHLGKPVYRIDWGKKRFFTCYPFEAYQSKKTKPRFFYLESILIKGDKQIIIVIPYKEKERFYPFFNNFDINDLKKSLGKDFDKYVTTWGKCKILFPKSGKKGFVEKVTGIKLTNQ